MDGWVGGGMDWWMNGWMKDEKRNNGLKMDQ
jgi:hypothetical protein